MFLIICTTLEAFGDATIRKGILVPGLYSKILIFLLGTVLLFGYGFLLNLAPISFEKIVGLYIATLFVVWQFVSYISFGAMPTLATLLSGILIVSGGLLLFFWK